VPRSLRACLEVLRGFDLSPYGKSDNMIATSVTPPIPRLLLEPTMRIPRVLATVLCALVFYALDKQPLAYAQTVSAPSAYSTANAGRGHVKGPHEFFFTRGIYSGGGGDDDRGARWAIDYPKADLQFLVALKRLSIVDAYESDNTVALDDPELRRFPFLYILEVGSLSMTDSEVRALRNYLLAGGFMVVDDFWGTWAWENFESEMKRVFPDRRLVEIPLDHPVFHVFYDITEILQVPNVYQAHFVSSGGPTYEYDGYVPHVRGMFDDEGRLMVLVNWNTDLGDAWEWADDPEYPLKFSTFAFEMGINFVIYAMSH
jgi:hypothetical protein